MRHLDSPSRDPRYSEMEWDQRSRYERLDLISHIGSFLMSTAVINDSNDFILNSLSSNRSPKLRYGVSAEI
jgi:hypothetical protein